MGVFYVVFLTLCVLGSSHAAYRPKRCRTFQETMKMCLAQLGGSFGLQPGGGHELLSDLNTTKTLCKDGKLQDAMTCLEEVYNECAEAARAHNQQPSALNLMLDVGKWRNSMERLCVNIDYLRQYDQCTRVIAVQSSHCIQAETRSFMDNSNRVMSEAMKKGWTGQKQLMDLGCKFAREVIYCFKNPLETEDTCPCHYRQLMVDIVADSMPPFCKPDLDFYYYDDGDCAEEDEAEADPEGNVLQPVQPSTGVSRTDGLVSRVQDKPDVSISLGGVQEGGQKGGYKVHEVAQGQEQGRGGGDACSMSLFTVMVAVATGVVAVLFH